MKSEINYKVETIWVVVARIGFGKFNPGEIISNHSTYELAEKRAKKYGDLVKIKVLETFSVA